MAATETPVSNVVPTRESEATCEVCGITVKSFYGLPHMWRFILREDNDTKPLPVNNDRICMDCMTDLIKFKVEVLAKKNR
jgi:hypothetical protein